METTYDRIHRLLLEIYGLRKKLWTSNDNRIKEPIYKKIAAKEKALVSLQLSLNRNFETAKGRNE